MGIKRGLTALALTLGMGFSQTSIASELELIGISERMTGQNTVRVLTDDENVTHLTYWVDKRREGPVKVKEGRADIQFQLDNVPYPHNLRVEAWNGKNFLYSTEQMLNPGGSATLVEFISPGNGSYLEGPTDVRVCARLASGDDFRYEGGSISPESFHINYKESKHAMTPSKNRWGTDIPCQGGMGRVYSANINIDPSQMGWLEARLNTAGGREDQAHIIINTDPRTFADSIDVNVRNILVRALDSDRKPVEGLTSDNFAVREDLTSTEVIDAQRIEDAPLNIAVVFDGSGSTQLDDDVEEVVRQHFFELFDPAKDRAILYAISTYAQPIIPDWTSDVDVIDNAFASMSSMRQGSSAVYETLEEVIYKLQMESKGAGVILYMTDGTDTVTETGDPDGFRRQQRERSLVKYAAASGVKVYSLAVSVPIFFPENNNWGTSRVNEDFLKSLSSETGGSYQYVGLPGNLKSLGDSERKYSLELSIADNFTRRDLQEYYNLIDQNTHIYGNAWRQEMESLQTMTPKEVKEFYRERERVTDNIRDEQERVARELSKTSTGETVGRALQAFVSDVRSQYVLSILTPHRREGIVRSLEISVDHPAVRTIEGPKNTFY